jgi:ribosomal protein S18 acetylase RimI-like enzyme
MPNVRSARIDDLQELLKCFTEVWESLTEWLPKSFVDPELEGIRSPEGIENFKQGIESKNGIFLIAEENNEIVGMVKGRENAGVCSLLFLGVRKENRHKGVGRNLLNRFFEEAKRRKAHKIWLFTSPKLQPAIRVYISNGFVPEGMLRKHTHGLDYIIYSKFL